MNNDWDSVEKSLTSISDASRKRSKRHADAYCNEVYKKKGRKRTINRVIKWQRGLEIDKEFKEEEK